MSRQRFIALLLAAVVAISGALYLSTQRNLPRDPHGSVFLPSLPSEMTTLTSLSLRKGSPTPAVTLQKQGDQWSVKERGNYPADLSKLRKLLLALSDARVVEEKTSNPASFPIIGVEDPALPGATGTEINLVAQDGRHAVIIGKSVGEGNFARRTGENKSYIVAPAISFESEPRFWIDSRLIDVAAAMIHSVEVKPASGPAFTVHRIKPDEPNFILDGVPPGRKALEPASLGPSPTTYSGLTVDDVVPAGEVDFSKATVATVLLSDANTLTLTGSVVGDKHWIQINSTKDSALNAKTAGRAFELPSYRYEAIFRTLEQLLVPKEPLPTKKPAATAGPAAKKPLSSPTP